MVKKILVTFVQKEDIGVLDFKNFEIHLKVQTKIFKGTSAVKILKVKILVLDNSKVDVVIL